MSAIPLFPLNMVLFPDGILPLRIFETRYVDMVKHCMRESRGFGVVLIRSGNEVGPAQMHAIGTLARITDFDQLPDGLLGLSCLGHQRFRILERRVQADGLNLGDVEFLPVEPTLAVPQRHAHLARLLEEVLPQLGEIYTDMPMQLDDAAWVGHRLAEILPLPLPNKQMCLELDDPLQRLDVLAPLIQAASSGTLNG